MCGYLARRILATIPVLAIVALVVFSILHLAPGDPAALIAGDQAHRADPAIRSKLGLDLPFHEQFILSGSAALLQRRSRHLDLHQPAGHGAVRPAPRADHRARVLTTIIAVTLAVPIGVLAAWSAGTAVDRA